VHTRQEDLLPTPVEKLGRIALHVVVEYRVAAIALVLGGPAGVVISPGWNVPSGEK
jgi:hypothetical protein